MFCLVAWFTGGPTRVVAGHEEKDVAVLGTGAALSAIAELFPRLQAVPRLAIARIVF